MINFPGHGKAYAEYGVTNERQLALIPAIISFEEAAAATLAAQTAWQALVHNARIKAGQKVLIYAASGGVGHFTVQIANYLGAHVTGSSSLKNKDFVVSLGTDSYINYLDYAWKEHPEEFDFVLDTIGGENIDKSILVTKPGGTIISIPTELNEDVKEKSNAKGIHGYFILVNSNGDNMNQIASLLENGILKAHISKAFAFEDIAAAHTQVESGRTVGKVIITL